jgi:CubicO group peptidase (beta-lactamase class C family)
VPLDEFVRTRITGPLGLKDTQFFLPQAHRDRLAAVYASGSDGRITRAPDGPKGQGDYVDGPRRSFAGGAGLLSTARDYARFLEMIRNGGALDGVRILAPRTVELMTTNQVGSLHSKTGLGFGLFMLAAALARLRISRCSCIGAVGRRRRRKRAATKRRPEEGVNGEPESRQHAKHAPILARETCLENTNRLGMSSTIS